MGCAFGERSLRERSAQSSRGSHDPPGRTRRSSRGAKGHRWSASNNHTGRAMRRARVVLGVASCRQATRWTTGERSDTETVTLRSGRREKGWKQYLACRLLNLDHPFKHVAVSISFLFLFLPFPGEIPVIAWEMEPNSRRFGNRYSKEPPHLWNRLYKTWAFVVAVLQCTQRLFEREQQRENYENTPLDFKRLGAFTRGQAI